MDEGDVLDWIGVDLSGNQPTIKSNAGHNHKHELDKYAEEARLGLNMVEEGEDHTIAGWITYGNALNKGRAEFPSDEQFGQWVREQQLAGHSVWEDRAAAMWAAANPEQFEQMREKYPNVRTLRGSHAKWKKEQKDREGEKDKPKAKSAKATNEELGKVFEGMQNGTISPEDAKQEIESAKNHVQEAINKFNSLSDEDKIAHLGEPTVIDQSALDNKLEENFNPRNAAISVLVSLNRLRIYGGKESIRKYISNALDESTRMKAYEAEALVLLSEVVFEFKDELQSLYKTKPNLNAMN